MSTRPASPDRLETTEPHRPPLSSVAGLTVAFVTLALLSSLILAAAGRAATDASTYADGVRVGAPASLPLGTRLVGTATPERRLRLWVALAPSDGGALADFATEVSSPESPAYGRYLNVAQFAERFGATDSQIAAVRRALEARGLSVGDVAANHLSLPVTATVAETESALGIRIDRVSLPEGRTTYANADAPEIPAAAAPFVEGVIGLAGVSHSERGGAPAATVTSPSQASIFTRGATLRSGQAAGVAAAPTAAAVTGTPCEEALTTQREHGGYTPDQIASAYRFDGLYEAGDVGGGQAVALLELEPYSEADIAEYQSCFGTAASVSPVDVAGGPGTGPDGESALDIEQVVGLAPGAKVLVYQAKNEGDDELEIIKAWVEQDTAKVMSDSWGRCEKETEEPDFAVAQTLLEEAASQGQSFFVASGDSGSSGCYSKPTEEEEEEGSEPDLDQSLSVDGNSAQPFATAVGGTRLQTPSVPPTEYIWNDGEEGGAGGGGISTHFAMPAYQAQAASGLGVVNSYSSGTPCGNEGGYCREVPDVSADAASETGYVVHTEGHWETSGGTSASAPLWAAVAALTDADPACQGHAIGFVNPALYSIAGSSFAANFHDITEAKPGGLPTNNIFSASNPYPPTAGYDMATGLGSPIVSTLAASLCALAAPATPPAPESTPSPSGSAAPTPTPPAPSPTPPTTTRPGKIEKAILKIDATGARLSFRLTARSGSSLRSVSIQLPAGLAIARSRGMLGRGILVSSTTGKKLPAKVSGSGRSLRIQLGSAVEAAQFRIGPPALRAQGGSAGSGKKRTVKATVAVSVGETGGGSSRYTIATKV